jgi:uncharacterized low-complexity protein
MSIHIKEGASFRGIIYEQVIVNKKNKLAIFLDQSDDKNCCVYSISFNIVPCAEIRCAETRCAETRCAVTRCAVTMCAETRCAETRCAETRCAETRCAETMCAETRCAETRCAETRCAETRCAETMCAETRCAETRCAETRCAETRCAETRCAETRCAEDEIRFDISNVTFQDEGNNYHNVCFSDADVRAIYNYTNDAFDENITLNDKYGDGADLYLDDAIHRIFH